MKLGEWIILIGVVVWVFLMLFRSFGRRPSEQAQRPPSENPLDMRVRGVKPEPATAPEPTDTGFTHIGVTEPKLKRQWGPFEKKALQVDSDFSMAHFLEGACKAFFLVMKAFASGDMQKLESLVNKKALKVFEKLMKARQTDGTHVLLDGVHIKDIKVEEVVEDAGHMLITVRFVSEQQWVYLDSKGAPMEIEGPSDQTDAVDVWTFSRDIKSADTRWTLVEFESLDHA